MRKTAKNGKINTSKTASIYDPKSLKQRPFYDDYGKGFEGKRGSQLKVDIDGNPLSAEIIAGRRVAGGGDKGITGSEAYRIASGMDIRPHKAVRSGPDLKGDVGRYVGGQNRRVIVSPGKTLDMKCI